MGLIEDLARHKYSAKTPQTRINTHGILRTHVPKPGPSAPQRDSVVRISYAKADKLGSSVKYLTREGKTIEDGRPQLFCQNGRTVSDELQPMPGEKNHFRMIISPADGQKLDLERHARQVMKSAERVVGQKLHWVAAVHSNTENPHVHLVVRGASDGKEVRFERDMIKNGFRGISREAATKELGPKTRAEMRRERNSELRADRFTKLDQELAGRERSGRVVAKTSDEQRRLNHLQSLGIARWKGSHTYQMAASWEIKLKDIGRLSAIHSRMTNDLKGTGLAKAPKYAYEGANRVTGTIVAKHWDDTRDDRPYAIVRNSAGDCYYLKHEKLESAREGDRVELDPGKPPVVISKDRQQDAQRMTEETAGTKPKDRKRGDDLER